MVNDNVQLPYENPYNNEMLVAKIASKVIAWPNIMDFVHVYSHIHIAAHNTNCDWFYTVTFKCP